MESTLDRLDRRCVLVTQRIAVVGVFAMLAIAFTTIADILLRWLFNAPIPGAAEVMGLALGVAVSACFPSGAALRVNLTIEMLGGHVPPAGIAWLKAVGSLLLLVFYAFITWRIALYAQALQARGMATTFVQMPVYPYIWAIAFFVAITTFVQCVSFMVCVRYALAGIPDPSGWSLESGEKKAVAAPPAIAGMQVLLASLSLVALAAILLYTFQLAHAPLSELAKASPLGFSLIMVGLIWVLLFLYVPLAVALGAIGVVTGALSLGIDPILGVLGNESAQFITNHQVAVVPMFLMMGAFAVVAGMAQDIYDLAHALFARFRGGLALATIGGCGGFGALTGSSLATVATIGRVAMPEMTSRGYSPQLAAGAVAAGGTLGALVPPSIPLIFYAFLTETSIGQLFIAAVVPAIIAIAFYMLAIIVSVRIRPAIAPASSDHMDWGAVTLAVRRSWAGLALFAIVLGGIYGGIFTETEAAAVGAAGAFLFALARGRMNRKSFFAVMGETTGTTALLYLIIFGVLTFSFAMGVTGLPQRMTQFFTALQWSPLIVIFFLLAIYIALGCIMDSSTVMFVTVPIVSPLVVGMGYDLVWWGVVNLIVLELGLITPPFGLHLFVLKSLGGSDTPLGTVYRGVVPFVIADFIKLALIVLVPATVMWLPSTMVR
ncbi:MAG: TRAP transporter large permease subunit [Burkholderiales bacterium]